MTSETEHDTLTHGADPFTERLERVAASLAPAARRVARFIADNRALVLVSSASTLASRIGTSDATVVRTVQALGYGGLPDLKRVLATSLGSPDATPADAMRGTLADAGAEPDRVVDQVIDIQRGAVAALAAPEARATLKAAVAALRGVNRIQVFGVGPSAALAHYISVLLSRAGRQGRALNMSGMGLADQLLDMRSGDGLLVLAYGRSYREVVAVFAEARRLNLPVVLVTDSLDRSLARHADVVVAARRGRAGRVALHGATLVALEAIVMGLAAAQGNEAVATLERLNELRAAIVGSPTDVG